MRPSAVGSGASADDASRAFAWGRRGSVGDELDERSGLLDYASQARARSQERSLTGLLAQLYLLTEDFVLASLFVTLTFVVRLIILTLALPLFALAAFTGLVDGLVRRDLRKFDTHTTDPRWMH